METIEIPLSKRKLLLLLVGSLAFVALGIWFLTDPDKLVNPILQSRTLVLVVGATAILFFGWTGIVAVKKLLDKRMGLIINAQGITDNSSGVSGGQIPWSEITGIDVAQVQNQRFILILVTDPEKYIEAQPGSFKKRMMKINYRMYQTPICISANSLQCNFDELYQTVRQSFNKYKRD